MRRPIWYYVKLGSFWLRGEYGWGARVHADIFTIKDANKKVEQLKARGIVARVTPV